MGYRDLTEFERDELLVLGPAGVEVQEARGQAKLVQSEQLPIDGSEEVAAKKSPIQWGEKVNELFRKAILPPGWRKVPTSHTMWSDLVDAKGCPRASIFYKAAFYDERASIHFIPRYHSLSETRDSGLVIAIYDRGQGPAKVLLHTLVPSLPDQKDLAYYSAIQEAQREALAWLAERYPDYQDPTAYWDPE